MYLPLFIVLAAVLLIVQLLLCFKSKKVLIRLIPAILILLSQAVCGIVYTQNLGPHGAVFAAAIYLILLAMLLAADGIGWLIFGIIWLIQKVRK